MLRAARLAAKLLEIISGSEVSINAKDEALDEENPEAEAVEDEETEVDVVEADAEDVVRRRELGDDGGFGLAW